MYQYTASMKNMFNNNRAEWQKKTQNQLVVPGLNQTDIQINDISKLEVRNCKTEVQIRNDKQENLVLHFGYLPSNI